MKVTIEVDCTPSEARRFLGLPELEPLQQAVMKRLEEQMLEQMANLSPEGLLRNWLSAGTLTAERFQDIFTGGASKRASGKAD
jgi:hypothetical protein